jgi:hypothetical protein
MSRLRQVLLAAALVVASALLVTHTQQAGRGPDYAVAPSLLLARLRLNCKVPVLY